MYILKRQSKHSQQADALNLRGLKTKVQGF